MSGGSACKCSESKEPLRVTDGANRPARLWRVMQRQCNHSAFNGGHYTPSAYSSITCLRCGAVWRTKSAYVFDTPDFDIDTEINIRPGTVGYREAMTRLGREPLNG